MIILGIIGSLVGLGGSVMTVIGGFGGAVVSNLAKDKTDSVAGAFVFWSGITAAIICMFALVFSITGGVAKKKNAIATFALATLVTGALNIYMYNWVSGALIGIAGILGLIGAKDGVAEEKPITKSIVFYSVVVVLLALTGFSFLIKNGNSIKLDTLTASVQQAPTAAPAPAPVPAPATAAQGDPSSSKVTEIEGYKEFVFGLSRKDAVGRPGCKASKDLPLGFVETKPFDVLAQEVYDAAQIALLAVKDGDNPMNASGVNPKHFRVLPKSRQGAEQELKEFDTVKKKYLGPVDISCAIEVFGESISARFFFNDVDQLAQISLPMGAFNGAKLKSIRDALSSKYATISAPTDAQVEEFTTVVVDQTINRKQDTDAALLSMLTGAKPNNPSLSYLYANGQVEVKLANILTTAMNSSGNPAPKREMTVVINYFDKQTAAFITKNSEKGAVKASDL